MECEICRKDAIELWCNDGIWHCADHSFERDPEGKGSFYARSTVFIPGYGNESKARLDEVTRRVIVKMNKDGTYVLGRRGENGKVQDRQPNYYK